MATKKPADPVPSARTVLYLLDLLAQQSAEIEALKAWKAQVEAEWPQILEANNVTAG